MRVTPFYPFDCLKAIHMFKHSKGTGEKMSRVAGAPLRIGEGVQ